MASSGLRARGAGAKEAKDWAALWQERGGEGDGDEDGDETEGTDVQSLWEAEVAAIWVEGRSFEGGEGVDSEAGRSETDLRATSLGKQP
jgi:hypothetical protein